MSIEIQVYCESSHLPTFDQWAKAIESAGFPISFPESIDLIKHSGYLPAIFREEESGFEYYLNTLGKEIPQKVLSLLPTANTVIGFVFHGEEHEMLTADASAAVLASLTNGVFFDTEGDEAYRNSAAIAYAKKAIEDVHKRRHEKAVKHSPQLNPLQWAKAFEQTLKHIHPDYALSKDFRGRLVECTRMDSTGLFLSQNCEKYYDDYNHCFAVLLTTTKLGGAPFILGSRFDHNFTVCHAYSRDYRAGQPPRVCPKEWHSTHRSTQKGTQEYVESCARSAEQFLFPLYMNRLSEGVDRMLALMRDAASFLDQWEVSEELLNAPAQKSALTTPFVSAHIIEEGPEDWEEYLITEYNALRLADAHGFSGTRLLSHRQEGKNNTGDDIAVGSKHFMSLPPDLRNVAIFVYYIRDFLTVRDELPRIIEVLANLKAQHKQKKPWWRFW